MAVAEEIRRMVEEFLAPEFRAIKQQLEAFEKASEARHRELLARIEVLLNDVESLKSALAFVERFDHSQRGRRERPN